MEQKIEISRIVDEAIMWMAEQYARNPYAYLNEASVEARLSMELRERLEPEGAMGKARESIRLRGFGKKAEATYLISSVQTQYWKGGKIEIAIINQPGANSKCAAIQREIDVGMVRREDTHITT